MNVSRFVKIALIALILYVAGILLPLAALLWAVQKDIVLAAYATGNIALVVIAVAVALLIGVGAWLKRLADRV